MTESPSFIQTFACLLLLLVTAMGEIPLHGQILDDRSDAPALGVFLDLGYGYRYHSLPVFSGSADCGAFDDGSLIRGTLGPELLLPSLFAPNFGLAGRLLLDISESHLATAAEPFVISQGEEPPVRFGHEYRLAEKRIAGRLELLADFRIVRRLGLRVGGGIGYGIAESYEQTDYITDPLDRFPGGLRERSMPQGGREIRKWTFGGIVSATTTLPLGADIFIAPQLSIREETRSSDAPINDGGLSGSFGISIGTFLKKPAVAPPLPAIPLSASIDLGLSPDADGVPVDSSIHVVEVLRLAEGEEIWRPDRTVYPPTLAVNPVWESSDGIREWEIRFLCEGEPLGRFTGDDPEEPSELNWKIADKSELDTIQTLEVRMIVIDSSGRTVTAIDSIHLHLRRSQRFARYLPERTVWTDLYPDSEGMTEGNRSMLLEVIDAAETGDRIILQPRSGNRGEISPALIERMHLLAAELHSLMRQSGKTGVRVDLLPTPEGATEGDLYTRLPDEVRSAGYIEVIVQRR